MGSILAIVGIPASFRVFRAFRRSSGVGAQGSMSFERVSSSVVIVIATTVFEKRSMSLVTRDDFVTISFLKSARSSRHFLVSFFVLSRGWYGSVLLLMDMGIFLSRVSMSFEMRLMRSFFSRGLKKSGM